MTDLDTGAEFVTETPISSADVNARFAAVENFVNVTGVPVVQVGAPGATVDVQTFLASGTWEKPEGAKVVEYLVVSGGRGGTGRTGTSISGGGLGSNSSFGNRVATNVAVSTATGTASPTAGAASSLGVPGGAAGTGTYAGGGGASGYGPGGAGGNTGGNSGVAAAANTGGGGGGAGGTGVAADGFNNVLGGAAGAILTGTVPASQFAATETVTVGAGTAGGSGTYSGGAGGSGIVIITTYF